MLRKRLGEVAGMCVHAMVTLLLLNRHISYCLFLHLTYLHLAFYSFNPRSPFLVHGCGWSSVWFWSRMLLAFSRCSWASGTFFHSCEDPSINVRFSHLCDTAFCFICFVSRVGGESIHCLSDFLSAWSYLKMISCSFPTSVDWVLSNVDSVKPALPHHFYLQDLSGKWGFTFPPWHNP